MKNFQKRSVLWISSGFFVYGAYAYAGQPQKSNSLILSDLGKPIIESQLQNQRARGEIIISASSSGNVGNNSVGAGSITGVISNTQSIQNNAGITNVLQNTGNNSLIQSSTSIYISAK